MFAKIFQQIFDSSVADNPDLRHMFMDLLVLADQDGVLDMTPNAISARTRIPIDKVKAWLAELEMPDPESRTPDMEGRRLVKLDPARPWGWRIVNFTKYRESCTREMLRMAEAERKRAYRDRYRPKRKTPPDPQKEKKEDKEAEAEAEESRTFPGHVPDKSPVPDMSRTSERASLQEVKFHADKIGLAPWKAEDWFHEMEGCGWLDHLKRPVNNWRAILQRVRTKWEADGRPSGPPARPKPAIRSTFHNPNI